MCKNIIIILIIVVLLIVFISMVTKERYGVTFEQVQKYIPIEAKNCPDMRARGTDLTDENFMRNNWKKVVQMVEDRMMPPEGYRHIWTESERSKFLELLTEWGSKKN